MEESLRAKNRIIASNLDFLREGEERCERLRAMELSSVADDAVEYMSRLFSEGLGIYEALSCLSDELSLASSDGADSPELEIRSTRDKASFSQMLANEMAKGGVEETDFLWSEELPAEFTYVRNAYSDEAYDVLSQDFDDPRVRYSRDFAECARLLYTGEVSYCLFPIEEKGGTRLPTVAELIYRYDFKVNAITPVFGPDDSMDLKYALVSNRFTVPQRGADTDRYLEIRVPSSSTIPLSSVLAAVSLLGHTVYRVDTQSLPTEGGVSSHFTVVIRDEGRDFLPLLVYLTVFCEGYAPIGIYKNLE